MSHKYARLIDVGRFARECENTGLAETVLMRALQHADEHFGPSSDESKSIRNDLAAFYLQQANATQSRPFSTWLDFDPALN